MREIVCLPAAEGSTLLVDRCAASHADPRLIAHLAGDEPPANARIVTRMYLADPSKGNCRPVRAADLELVPFTSSAMVRAGEISPELQLLDADGIVYRIRKIAADGSMPELRWTRSANPGREEPFDTLSLRDVVARFQAYEPARTITTDALAAHGQDPRLSSCRLRGELQRLASSPIVLNRGLREVIQRKVTSGELTMSEIAMRCGRVKRDRNGNRSGETSWLARRIGQLPEGGQSEPTPWLHTDVLALIARDGLGASPHEVEV